MSARPRARELQRDVAAERVADDVRFADARLVHRLLDGFDERGGRDRGRERRAAEVAGERRGEQRVVALEPRPHQLPHVRGAGEAVDQDQCGQRGVYSATMNGGWNWSAVSATLSVAQRYSWSAAVTSVAWPRLRSGGRNAAAVDEVEPLGVLGERPRACPCASGCGSAAAGTGHRRRSSRPCGRTRLNVMPFRLSNAYWRLRDGHDLRGAGRRRPRAVAQRRQLDLLHAALAGRADVQVVVADGERAGARREVPAAGERQPADGGARLREQARAELGQRRPARVAARGRGGSSRRGRSATARRTPTPRRRTRRSGAPRRPRRTPAAARRSRPCA